MIRTFYYIFLQLMLLLFFPRSMFKINTKETKPKQSQAKTTKNIKYESILG